MNIRVFFSVLVLKVRFTLIISLYEISTFSYEWKICFIDSWNVSSLYFKKLSSNSEFTQNKIISNLFDVNTRKITMSDRRTLMYEKLLTSEIVMYMYMYSTYAAKKRNTFKKKKTRLFLFFSFQIKNWFNIIKWKKWIIWRELNQFKCNEVNVLV